MMYKVNLDQQNKKSTLENNNKRQFVHRQNINEKMNRFRELKDKLIKSKRDSQKLDQSPFSQTELEDWVEKQLQYYGISKESYRLRELKNFSQANHDLTSMSKPNPEHMSSKDSTNENQNKQNAFAKKVGPFASFQNASPSQKDMSFGQDSYGNVKQSKQQEPSQSSSLANSQSSSKRLISKKPKNYHASSMNDAQQIIQTSDKLKYMNLEENNSENLFKSCQQQEKQNEFSYQPKQLDYYTLILQLTAQLNYSRVNKETSNEKSILNQIKNLISFIESKSATQAGTEPSAQQNSEAKIKTESQQSHHHTNIKSNHTFSSVFSNQSMANEIDHDKSPETSEKRKIKYKLIGKQIDAENGFSHRRIGTEPTSSQRHQNNDEHNETFQSINAFEQNQEQGSDQEDKTSIIDMVNDQQNLYREDIFIQQSDDHQNSVMQNSPLSRITQRQSEYSDSANPSKSASPSKYTPEKIVKNAEKLQSKFLPHLMEKHIQSLYADNIFKKKPSGKKTAQYSTKMLPENQLILKRLSDRLENSEDPNHLFEQSIEYKRILYMLDSEYGNSDYKNRTFSSLFGQRSSSTLNQGGSDKENFQYSLKGNSEESVKSFARQIFESDESSTKQNHTRQSPCLMRKLDNLFKSECNMQTSSPKLLHFSSESDLESQYKQKQSHLMKIKNHKRSHTAKESLSHQNMNKNMKYRFNILSGLSQQINQQSQENAFDNNKYEPMRTQYNDDDSVYHKVSRHSYLTSSSAQNSNEPTSSEGECMDGIRKNVKKGSLIVKKTKKASKTITQKQNCHQMMKSSEEEDRLQKSMKFIVKKNPGQKNTHKVSEDYNHDFSQNASDIFTKKATDDQELILISMSDQATHRAKNISSKSISSHHSSCSNNSSNEKQQQEISYINNKLHEQSLNESKVSINSLNRQIKYKVYTTTNEIQPYHEKQDKRKVLKDIVSVLNTKYNRNIKLKQ